MQFMSQTQQPQALRHAGRSPVRLTAYRRRQDDAAAVDDVMTPVSPLDSPRLSTAFSSSDADLSSTTHSPARHNTQARSGGASSKRNAAMSPSSSTSSSSSLGTLFHRLNLRRSSTASSLESSPRKQQHGHSSDEDSGVGNSDTATVAATSTSSGVLSKLRKKSKSVGALRRRRKGEYGLRRQAAAHSDLMDAPAHQLQHYGTAAATTPSIASSTLGARSKSLDVLPEAVCQACRLQLLAATDSGVGSMSLTAPTDSPLWLGWHSADGGGGLGNHGKHGGGNDSHFLAQAQSNPDILAACDADDGDGDGADDGCSTGAVEVNHCRECGCLFRDTLASSPNIRVEFEQDYMC